MSDGSKVKLGKRLAAIEMMVSSHYDHIWDCCCDHGLLGFQLLKNNKTKHLHFVDVVAPLLIEIESKLKSYYQGDGKWSVHCLDVAKLPLEEYKNEKHLIIIAGIGGQLLVDLLTSLFPRSRLLDVEFILSPVHHNYQLREFLREQECFLIDEEIIEENKRFYELIHIKRLDYQKSTTSTVSLVGDKMWNLKNAAHLIYLQQTIKHYQRMAKNPNLNVYEIIKVYQDLIPEV